MEDILEAVRQGDEGQVAKLLDENPDLLNSMTRYQEWPLAEAAKHGQLGVVKLLAQRGANLNEAGRFSKTALHWAVEGGHEEVVAFLLSKDVRPNDYDTSSKTPLMWACECGHLGVVRMLVQHLGQQGMDATRAATIGLRWAAKGGHETMVKYLLGEGAQVTKWRDGWTALLEASARGHMGVVRMLVQHMGGQGLEEADSEGNTALYHAAREGHKEVVVFWLNQGAQTTKPHPCGMTALIHASMKGHLGVVRMLLQHMEGQGLDERDRDEFTALSHAAVNGHEEVVAILLGNGAQANIRGRDGMTPLMGASMNGHLGVVWVLVQHMGGQGLEETDREGNTALDNAARRGHKEIVHLLLSQGAQVTSRVLMLACSTGHLGVVQMLIQHMAEERLEERDRQGQTALYHAAIKGHEEVVGFLLSKGAKATSSNNKGVTPLMGASVSGRLGVVRLLVQHTGGQGLNARDADHGWTALYWAASGEHEGVMRYLLLSGADPTIKDKEGKGPPVRKVYRVATKRRSIFEVLMEWWEGELERRHLLSRAICLHKAYTTQRAQPSSRVPTYLEVRAAAGHALPCLELVLLESENQPKETEQAGASGKRKAAGESSDQHEAVVGGDEVHAMLTYVVEALNAELLTELLEGFHGPRK